MIVFLCLLYPDLNGFEGWMDKKMIFIGLEANSFHNRLALAILVGNVFGWVLNRL
jgi:hypothetical protein